MRAGNRIQKRLSLDGDHFYVALVFYNRLLRCSVLIDLKLGKPTHQDHGQMMMYVNWFDRFDARNTSNRPCLVWPNTHPWLLLPPKDIAHHPRTSEVRTSRSPRWEVPTEGARVVTLDPFGGR